MFLIGLLCLLTGLIMNFRVLRGPMRGKLTPEEIVRTPPWLISAALVGVGFLLIVLGAR
jgi:hypothetical protein